MLEDVGNDIISYARAKEIVTAYENEMIEENYRNNRAREEGYDKGHEEGIEQGIEQGSMEANKKNAKAMLEKGIDSLLISEITGLTIQEIKKL